MTKATSENAVKKILVTGSSGMVGTALCARLEEEGHRVLRLVRSGSSDPGRVVWNPLTGEADAQRLEELDAVVHLAGENIAGGRWTSARKDSIRRSRVEGTKNLCTLLTSLTRKPKALVAASAIGFYGDRGDDILDESAHAGTGFLAETCRAWEEASSSAVTAGIRTVLLRIGVVLAREGGALAKMLFPFKIGMGGRIGTGRQHVSWITAEDLVSAIVHCIDNAELAGPVNAVAPHPVTNLELTRALGKALHRPTIVPLPAFMARILLGEMADELLLSSTRVLSRKLEASGFSFASSRIDEALEKILG